MTTKHSYRELLIFSQLAQQWTTRHPEKTKLAYAIERVLARFQKLEVKIQDELGAIDLEHAATENGTGIVLVDPANNFKYEKEELKKRNLARGKFLDDAKWELEPFLVKVIPDELTEIEMIYFGGLVLDPVQVQELIVKREAEFTADETSTSTSDQ